MSKNAPAWVGRSPAEVQKAAVLARANAAKATVETLLAAGASSAAVAAARKAETSAWAAYRNFKG